ncbi:MAG: sugar transferase [Bacteroidota bacterium]
MNKNFHTAKYLFFDVLSASVAWILFSYFRKSYIELAKFGYPVQLNYTTDFFISILVIICFWVIIYAFSGYYYDIYRKSRVQELYQTFVISIIGVIILFFAFLLDDQVSSYTDYYFSFSVLFLLHFTLTYIPRLTITSGTIYKIRNKKIGFNTLIIGSNGKAKNVYEDFFNRNKSAGYRFLGFVNVKTKISSSLKEALKHLGSFDNVHEIVKNYKIEEIIIAVEVHEHSEIQNIITALEHTKVRVKIIPDLFEILIGKIELSLMDGTPLLRVSSELMPVWEKNFKKVFDIILSFLFIILMSPVYLSTAIAVKLSSKGPIIYKQKRVGKNGKVFNIFKFRSMVKNAEKDGPTLSFVDDPRITKLGMFMRKTRLDEIPQFINVILGDMSIVGPRPERQYYIDQIIQKAPEYMLLLKVKPGITSLGQVKFGYAENLEQMLERLKFDVIYIKNMSLYFDFKILINTVLTVMKRDGK